MTVQQQYLTYVLEQLEGLGPVRQSRMFGGVGLYSAGLFFGLLDDDALFLKADARNVGDFVARNMPRFMASPSRPAGTPGYYQVPADVLEDPETLVKWARAAVAVALEAQARAPAAGAAAKKAKKTKKTKKKAPGKSAIKSARKDARRNAAQPASARKRARARPK